MSRKYFGTDGIRGRSNSWRMNAETAMRAGMAAGHLYSSGGHRPRVVIGKDTRLSCYMIEQAMTAGFLSVGMDVLLFGPLPTPAVAMLTRSLRADLGVMISASHNKYHDNGIKLFGPDGYKMGDHRELEIEKLMEGSTGDLLAAPDCLGRARRIEDSQARYIEFAKRTFPRRLRLDGIKVVIDCANGAGYRVAPEALWELGAEIVPIGVEPDGMNINDNCGSTELELVRSKVLETGAAIGIALDGDADRVIIIDEKGQAVDGDQLMALIATTWAEQQKLEGGGLVSTVMSNLGLERYLLANNIALHRTKVGDRYVVEHMRAHGFNVGGEQSGHIVLSDFSTTGDGLIAALQVLATVMAKDKPVSEVCNQFEALPQVLRNVRFSSGKPLELDSVKAAIADGQARLDGHGRLLIRPSGTEPLIRVMAEGEDETLVNTVVSDIIDVLEKSAA